MAVWTHRLASAISHSVVRHICSSGTKIYYVDDFADDIYEYDPNTNTETLIIDASAISNYDTTIAITWFNGNLYIYDWYNTNVLKVERWTGSVNGLATVKTFTNTDFSPTQAGMMSNSNTIVAFTVNNPASPAPSDAECWYSSNGSSWNAGSWSVDIWSPPDLNGPYQSPKNTYFPTGLYREFVTATDAGRTTTTEISIFSFSGSTWTKIAVLTTSGPNANYLYSSPNEGIHWNWTAGKYYTDSTFASTITIGSSPSQTYQVNMPYSVAINLSPNCKLYQYAAGAWVLLDTFTVGWDLDGDKAIVRLTDGTLYMVAYSSIGASYDVRIFERDTPIIDTCSPAQFYYGYGVPVFASNLPFCGTTPGALAIAPEYQLAVIGKSGASGTYAVVYGNYPYTVWNDISGIIPNAPETKSIKLV